MDPCSAMPADPFLLIRLLRLEGSWMDCSVTRDDCAPLLALLAGGGSLGAGLCDVSLSAGVGGSAPDSDKCKDSSSDCAGLFRMVAFASGVGASPISKVRASALLAGLSVFLAVFGFVDVSGAASRLPIEALAESVEAFCML